MKLADALQNYMKNSYTKFQANHKVLVGVLGAYLFTFPCTLPIILHNLK
jgi:hypothetical protein